MKLFLSSIAIHDRQKQSFADLVGKGITDIRFALIENAADPYPDNQQGFVRVTRENLEKLGMQITLCDLRGYRGKHDELLKKLSTFDVVWFGGGNVFYLRWLLREVGLDQSLRSLLEQGVVYGGGSAGAIVAGPSLEAYDQVDDPLLAPETIYTGLGLVDFFLVPHWGTEEYHTSLSAIKKHFEEKGLRVITITDTQSVIVSNAHGEVILH